LAANEENLFRAKRAIEQFYNRRIFEGEESLKKYVEAIKLKRKKTAIEEPENEEMVLDNEKQSVSDKGNTKETGQNIPQSSEILGTKGAIRDNLVPRKSLVNKKTTEVAAMEEALLKEDNVKDQPYFSPKYEVISQGSKGRSLIELYNNESWSGNKSIETQLSKIEKSKFISQSSHTTRNREFKNRNLVDETSSHSKPVFSVPVLEDSSVDVNSLEKTTKISMGESSKVRFFSYPTSDSKLWFQMTEF
jgi:hypothetical protein